MIPIFIQYANDDEGLQIGLDFREYLLNHRLNPFLAGSGSPDINFGEPDTWVKIRQKLIASSVIISICSDGFELGEGVIRELDIRDEEAPHIRIIPFLKRTRDLPERLSEIWRIKYDPDHYSDNFCELTLAIYREYQRKMSYIINGLMKESRAAEVVEFYGE